MKTAIAFLTKDRVELSRQSIEPLLQPDKFDLFWIDGSSTSEGVAFPCKVFDEDAKLHKHLYGNVRGGAGAGIVFALTTMLNHSENYDVVGLVENDVLLRPGWLDCLALFQRGNDDGLAVGAVSARCFEDRVLFQRSGYAVCHNLGAGMVLLTRDAARLILACFRTGWTTDNRRIFSQLAGVDIGTFWAFRTNEHFTTADWWWDAVLAAHGYASLALTPSPVEMIGQDPPLFEQGLKIVSEPWYHVEVSNRMQILAEKFRQVRDGEIKLGIETQFHFDSNTGTWTYFPHQMHMLGGRYAGDWRLQEARGWGTFAWRAGDGWENRKGDETALKSEASLTVPVFGPCAVLVSGGKSGGQIGVSDELSGYWAAPILQPEGEQGSVLQLQVPGGISYRNVRVTALTPGVVFYGIQTREKQPCVPNAGFDYSNLPPV